MTVSRLDKYIREKEGLESLTRSDIENLQLRKLNEVLKREKARNGFYSGLPEQLGICGSCPRSPSPCPPT